MKFKGSRRAQIICAECRQKSPDFRVYLYNDEEGDQWNGEEPKGWIIDDEESLEEGGIIVGYCPTHLVKGSPILPEPKGEKCVIQ